MSEKPTMREALIDIAERAECTDDDDFRIDLEDRLKTIAETARAALAAEEESGWRTIKITGLSVLDDGRAEARFEWPENWIMKLGRYRLAKEG